MQRTVYLDHAATTPVDSEVLEKMLPYMTNIYGNANSQHTLGRLSMKAVDNARDSIAGVINCKPNEIYFTSGGTESDNWAIKGVALANKNKGNHIIISNIEHPAMIESAKQLQKMGFEIDFAPVKENGIVDINVLKSLLRKETIIVGIMMANNEVGVVQPIKDIAKIVHQNGSYMFTDAVQTAGVLKIDVKDLDVDLLSISSHKIYGPKGVGALYVKNGVKIESLNSGGHQERTKRGGTTNVAGVVGFAEALLMAEKNREKNFEYVKNLRDVFIEKIEQTIPIAVLNGDREKRLPANADFAFIGISGEEFLFNLDLNGIYASSGSACSSGSTEPSHVLIAMGLGEKRARSSIRFTFGKDNTINDVDYVVEKIQSIIEKFEKTVRLFKENTELKEV